MLREHVGVAEGIDAETIRRTLVEMLEARFNIHYATIQTETEPCGDAESLHK
jgi:cobalt-zinc-cadmium efflux system protein